MAEAGPTLRLYNTLTRRKEDFVPLDPANVRMYVCGPTVYDFAHIGNARPAIVFDVLFRLLRHVYGADHVTYVRNITDVDDKINARAARDYPGLPLNEAIRKVTETTAVQYQKDVTALGCLEPTVQPRATDNIPEMQRLIGSLQQRGHAYEAAGEVLFDVKSMPDYGALSGRNLEENLAGARVAVDAHKRNPADFVLWKQSSAEEPGWDSPWGRGRPGWHIECSAMSERYLWDEVEGRLSAEGRMHPHQFDIHAGGLDLIFPHHENEIAQSRCAYGTETMARYWMHNGFLQVEGQKMSKSLGNFFTIRELLDGTNFGGRSWPGEVLRLAMLMTHYRQPIDLAVARLEEASRIVAKWADAKLAINERFGGDLAALRARIPSGSPILDDLNLSPLIADLHRLGAEGAKGDEQSAAAFHVTLELLGFAEIELNSQGVANFGVLLDVALNERVQASISERLAALNGRDFAKADQIRADLLTQGIQLMDGKDAAGNRTTTWEIKR
ncbi:MAG TPA: cysteine--tRNA ligase [Devosia sp.]|nr:cysteine--tRNA ligase [Devosia sp.]